MCKNPIFTQKLLKVYNGEWIYNSIQYTKVKTMIIFLDR